MNSKWLGDSYDLVKRFFVGTLQGLGYRVYVDPMPTGDWTDAEPNFLLLLGAVHVRNLTTTEKSALLLDPDTGVGRRRSERHTTIPDIISELDAHDVVFVFDQSFSRGAGRVALLQDKLAQLTSHGASGFYYDSHASFLFAARSDQNLRELKHALFQTGLPRHRIILPKGRRAVSS